MSQSTQETFEFVLGHLADRMVRAHESLFKQRELTLGAEPAARKKNKRQEKEGAEDKAKAPPGVVFVVGAGCSIQYGLPGFQELLGYAYDDLRIEPPRDQEWGLDSLRDRLDPHWRTLKPAELREHLNRYLRRIHGSQCTAYLRLARLAQRGYVKAIVNMNFDLLLEEAFEDPPKDVRRSIYRPSRTFGLNLLKKSIEGENDEGDGIYSDSWELHQSEVPVYIPHGSLTEGQGVPILDLAGSDLFDTREEITAAETLFRTNDIVFLGYRGADAKIAAALTPDKPPSDRIEVDEENYNQIYVLNIGTPDPRLLQTMVARRSTELNVTGDIAGFENVMAELDRRIATHPTFTSTRPNTARTRNTQPEMDGLTSRREDASSNPHSWTPHSRHFTLEEGRALNRCRKLALDLRSSMTTAEGSQTSIEDHASKIFEISMKLASCAGIGLTAPEKYLLFCAAFLHDLGYFWAYSGNRKYQKAGWALLATHGHDTATLLNRHFNQGSEKWRLEEKCSILPRPYQTKADVMINTLIMLCHLHSGTPIPRPGSGPDFQLHADEPTILSEFDIEIEVSATDVSITVRPPLLHALFHTAEEITEGHPFRPSPYPVERREEDGREVEEDSHEFEDPVLDLYLRQKPRLLEFGDYKPGCVMAKGRTDERLETIEAAYRCLGDPNGHGDERLKTARELVGAVVEHHRQRQAQLDRTRKLLAALAKCAILHLDRVIKETIMSKESVTRGQGSTCQPGIQIRFDDEILLREDEDALRERLSAMAHDALDEQLKGRLEGLYEAHKDQPVGLVPTTLDLLTIYTDPLYVETSAPDSQNEHMRRKGKIPGGPKARAEDDGADPSVKSGIERAREILESADCLAESKRSLIYAYLRTRFWLDGRRPTMLERVFQHSFENIYRPAWRFCADKWLYGIDALVMARASLDLGSSRCRDEVVLGLKNLLDDKITSVEADKTNLPAWLSKRSEARLAGKEGWAFGHDGCTVCSSRLLYILTEGRRLLTPEMRESLGNGGRPLSATTGGILRFLLRRPVDDRAWWGIEAEQRRAEDDGRGDETLRSADYLAWAVKATGHALALDLEIFSSTGGKERWLEDECKVSRSAVLELFHGLLEELGKADNEHLLGEKTEEPHSYILGHVGGTYLYLRDLETRYSEGEILPPEFDWARRQHQVDAAVVAFDTRRQAQLSQFFVWPAEVFLAAQAEEDRRDRALIDTLERCLKSRVWIRDGEGRGSWGYNIENTQRIVSSLNSFWKLVFENPGRWNPHFERSWAGVLPDEKGDQAPPTRRQAARGAKVSSAAPPPPASGTPRPSPGRRVARGRGGRRTRS